MRLEDKVVAIVQARMGSSRFAGKMLSKLGDYPIIDWVLRRLLQARNIDEIILATSVAAENDVLQQRAEALGVSTFRGDEIDVLGRFIEAAHLTNGRHIVRVCGDNPFIAAEEVDRLIEHYRNARPDYAFNHIPRLGNSYPDGLGAEMLPLEILESVGRNATEPRHREHVTAYIWDHSRHFRILSVPAPRAIAFPNVKLDVDTPEDLNRLAALQCAYDVTASAASIIAAYRDRYGDGTA